MEFNFNKSEDPQENGGDLASDRLRKAIERNRKKQELRQKMEEGPKSESVPFQQDWTPPRSSRPTPPPRMEEVHPQASSRSSKAQLPTTLPTRQRVARPDDIDFTESPRRASTRRVEEIVEYAPARTRSNGEKRAKSAAAAVGRYRPLMIKAAWALVALATLRLVFVKRGVVEYYNRLAVLEGKSREFTQLVDENVGLSKEIERIKVDSNTQKKLVRDHLGFIAEDEFLILFPRETSPKSI